MTDPQTVSKPVEGLASVLFGAGFFEGDTLREELRAEAALRLAYALREEGVHPDSVHALALAVREVGDAAPLQEHEKEPLREEQKRMFQGLIAERSLPVSFRSLLEAALPRVVLRRDLVALYGVLSGAYERMNRIEAVRVMPADAPAPAPKR